MPTNVLVSLPDETYRRAQQLAVITGVNVSEALSDALSGTLLPLNGQLAGERPIDEMSDAEVEALADSRMAPAAERRFSKLRDKQQRGAISEQERVELQSFLMIYQIGLLRKAEALRVSVQRGLRESLKP